MEPLSPESPRRVALAPPDWMRPRREFARESSLAFQTVRAKHVLADSGECEAYAAAVQTAYHAARTTYELAHRGEWEKYVAAVRAYPIHSNYTNCAGRTSLTYAALDDKSHVIEVLMSLPEFRMANEPDKDGWTALHHAVRARNTSAVKTLVSSSRFTEVFARDYEGRRAADLIGRGGSKRNDSALADLLSRPRLPLRVES